ncbi:glycosyltransferase family 4 protein [Niveibacterium sp. SC-1]|uniref:glycosyltransferase family 4 protein n=1 Tax=Niveibacterium sp. SC-1 TaxID=3135646 RepID=UPI00311F3EA5
MLSPYEASHGGGVERVAYRLGLELKSLDISVKWISAGTDSVERPCDDDWLCVPCWNGIEQRTGIPVPIWGVRALGRLWRELGRVDVLIVHESLYMPCIAAALFAGMRRKPYLLIQHVGDVPYKSRFVSLIVSLGNRLVTSVMVAHARSVVFISAAVRDHVGRRRPDARLIPNGVDAVIFAPASAARRDALRRGLLRDPNRPALLFVGRFVEKKGLGMLRRLAGVLQAADWYFVGDGPMRPDEWGLSNVFVKSHLASAGLAQWYSAADLLVLPSYGEGFPLVVQEALACGLQVAIGSEVAVSLPGVSERVIHLPVDEAGSNTSSWKNAIEAWLDMGDDERAMNALILSDFARQSWSWRAAAEAYRDLLDPDPDHPASI